MKTKKNKLGVTYSLFCGEELLKASVMSIRKHVDYINVVWQEYSWTGEKANKGIEDFLYELHKNGLIDKVLKFEFDHKNEKNNYNLICCKKKI